MDSAIQFVLTKWTRLIGLRTIYYLY